MTRSYVAHSSASRSPLPFIVLAAAFLPQCSFIVQAVTSHLCIEVTHFNQYVMTWYCLYFCPQLLIEDVFGDVITVVGWCIGPAQYCTSVRLTFFPFILAVISLLLIGFYSSRHFCIPFLRMMATSSWCWLSSLPAYSTVSPVVVFTIPDRVHLHSLIPSVCTIASYFSRNLCQFSVSYMMRKFQKPILVLVLVLRTSIFLPFIRVIRINSERLQNTVVVDFSVAVSVTGF